VLPGDGRELVVAPVGADTFEELPDLEAPAPQVGPQHGDLSGRIVDLGQGDALDPPPDPELRCACRPNVAYPLGVAARRDEVAGAVELEDVDHRRADLSAPAASHLQLARSPDADAHADETAHRGVHDSAGEAVGGEVVGGDGDGHQMLLV